MAVIGFYATPEVQEAIKRLKEKGTRTFPSLLKHLGDDRYSFSGVSAAWLNHQVSDAVVDVQCDGHYMHSGYKGRETPNGWRAYLSFDAYLKSKGALMWAEWAKSRTLLEIQLDFIDWCVAEEDKRGYVDEEQKTKTQQIYARARERMRQIYTPTEKPKLGTAPASENTNSVSPPASSSR